MRPLRWWAQSAPPPGGDRVKVSENLGATSVTPVAPVDTSLPKFSSLSQAEMVYETDINILEDSY